MAHLLVSVIDAAEAEVALRAGADWVDVKNPTAGSLGMGSPEDIAGVVQIVADRRPVSVALGELTDWQNFDLLKNIPLAGVQRAKVGLAGTTRRGGSEPTWPERWRQLLSQLPASTEPVAVHYADWQKCDAPEAVALLDVAPQVGCTAFLVDTYFKQGQSLFDYYPPASLHQLVEQVHAAGMLFVAAGSVRIDHLPALIAAGGDIVAVRGAACRDSNRTAGICGERVAELKQALCEATVL